MGTRTRAGNSGFTVWAFLLLAATVVVPRAAQGQVPDGGYEAAVLAVVDRLFDGMREKDADVLRSVWHPEARLQSAAPDDSGSGVLRSTAVDDFIASVVSSQAYLDEVTFDEVVHITGHLATVWAPYNLFVDGAFQHCGVDAIQMIRTRDGWRIHQLTDTRTREGCDPDRRGDGG